MGNLAIDTSLAMIGIVEVVTGKIGRRLMAFEQKWKWLIGPGKTCLLVIELVFKVNWASLVFSAEVLLLLWWLT